MQKIRSVKHKKIWGYEIWLYSPLKGLETTFEESFLKNQGGPLVKIIKANQPLSVQVHPDDYWAQKLENEPNGKAESWFVLEHEKGAKVVLGLQTYDKAKILSSIKDKTFESLLKSQQVKKRDFFNIRAGVVHGLGAGIKVLEVQQPSNTTYRYYDYDRVQNGQARDLHIVKALKTQKDLPCVLEPIKLEPLTFKNALGTQMFSNQPCVLQEKSVVVNLDNNDTFLAQKGEEINFNNFAVISYTN